MAVARSRLFPNRSDLSEEDYQAMVADYQSSFGVPAVALLKFGKVKHGQLQKTTPFDPSAMTKTMQQTIMSYWTDTPRGHYGETLHLTSLKCRQGGSTTTTMSCAYVKTQYRPGWRHVTIADKVDRVRMIHGKVNYLDRNWPDLISVPKQKGRGQATFGTYFDQDWGGEMVIQSAKADAEGIGDSPDSFVASECGFWADFNKQMGLITPALINRNEGLVHYECTPVPIDAPSAEAWRNHCVSARQGLGRNIYHFTPYWDSLFNARPWDPTNKLTQEEINYLDKYGADGLTKDNLQFRRFLMDTSQEFQENPDLFDTYYPPDDVHCWGRVGKGVIHPTHLRYMISRFHDRMVAWPNLRTDGPDSFDDYRDADEEADAPLGELKVYRPYNPNAVYVFCCDPSGYGVRDEAAWHIFEVWRGEVEQAVTYASRRSQPDEVVVVALRWLKRYGMPYVIAERNGVGAAILTGLKLLGYDQDKVYGTGMGPDWRPGWVASEFANQEALSHLIGMLRAKELLINDKETYSQLLTYKNDKAIEHSMRSELIRRTVGQTPTPNRRARHHWDRVSALTLLAVVIREHMVPLRSKPTDRREEDMDKSDWDELGIPYEHFSKVRELQAKDRKALREGPQDGRFPEYRFGVGE